MCSLPQLLFTFALSVCSVFGQIDFNATALTNGTVNATVSANVNIDSVIDIASIDMSLFQSRYQLVWSDEFNTDGEIDQNVWTYETGNQGGYGNGEMQTYTSDPRNVYCSNGALRITATSGDGNYYSGRINTMHKKFFKFGLFTVRAKMPFGKGYWPAIWMLGETTNEIQWPNAGEIDILELIGGGTENVAHASVHWPNSAWPNNDQWFKQDYTLNNGTFSDDYHIYWVEWTPEFIAMGVDSNKYFYKSLQDGDNLYPYRYETAQSFFFILNLAVGGKWPGAPDYTTQFPQTMSVDYVRVYQS